MLPELRAHVELQLAHPMAERGLALARETQAAEPFDWRSATLESQGFSSSALASLQASLAGLNTKALLVIRDERLYLASHRTFEDYGQARWGYERAHLYRLSAAGAELVRSLHEAEAERAERPSPMLRRPAAGGAVAGAGA